MEGHYSVAGPVERGTKSATVPL